jgi:hypothetical protein
MKRIAILTGALLMVSAAYAGPSDDQLWQQFQSDKAMKGLDAEFEEKQPEPEVIVKEKVIVKEVPVERVKVVEKVVIKEVPVEKEVIKEVPAPVAAPAPKPAADDGRTFNKAFFDIHSKTQAPILDYIAFKGQRRSFDVEHFANMVSKIRDQHIDVYIQGNIAVPDSITTEQVYVNVGPKYSHNYYNYWKKNIYYNGSDIAQNAEDFLANVKTDKAGNRYVDYKIHIHLHKPWKIRASEQNVAPNTYFFKLAPKVRGYQNKFENADVYLVEE